MPSHDSALAVLISGGLDSAILLGQELRNHPAVYPLFIRFGLAWEAVEKAYLDHFLEAVSSPALQPLIVLEQPVADLYGEHWSLSGREVPRADDRDEAVF